MSVDAEGVCHRTGLDRDLWSIFWLSLRVVGSVLQLNALVGIPFGTCLGLTRFRGWRMLTRLPFAPAQLSGGGRWGMRSLCLR